MLNGTTNSIGVNAATNQLSGAYYDGNGNMTSGAGGTFTYDEANRMASAQETGGGIEYYAYTPKNKQVYRMLPNGNEEFTLWGARGEKLGVFSLAWSSYTGSTATPLRSYVYFAGKLIWAEGGPVYQDRVGTNRAMSARFYPFGDEITSTSNDRLKFATYTRDSYTGLDYADQREYASMYGRFNTADPYQASGGSSSPASWNRYSYTRGDPINRVDPRGLDDCPIYAYIGSDCDDGSGNPCDAMSSAYDPNDPTACLDYEEGDPTPTEQPPEANSSAPAPSAPSCSITEYERPVAVVAEHTYLDVSDPTLGISDILEGAPTNHPSSPNPFGGNWGTLNGVISGTFDANAPAPLRGDNPATNTVVASLTGGASVCSDVLELLSSVANYDSGAVAQSPYRPVPRHGSGYANSNSFTFTLLSNVGMSYSSWVPSGWAPGWGISVLGLAFGSGE